MECCQAYSSIPVRAKSINDGENNFVTVLGNLTSTCSARHALGLGTVSIELHA